MLRQLDLTSLFVLIFAGVAIAVMLFSVVRHHLHRHALRLHERAQRTQPFQQLGKDPPVPVQEALFA